MDAPITTLAVYQAKDISKKNQILETIRSHQALLVSKGYVTPGPPVLLSQEDYFIEVVSWKAGAADGAHADPDVAKVWKKFDELVNFKTLADLPNAKKTFPDFVPLKLAEVQCATLADTMIPSKNYKKLASFYNSLSDLPVEMESQGFINLRDTRTGNVLCIVDSAACSQSAPSFGVANLPSALERAKKFGAQVIREWDYEAMSGANLRDPDNNEFLMWQMKEQSNES